MKNKLKVLSSVKLDFDDDVLKKLKKKVNLNFSINSKKETLKKIIDSDVYIASAAIELNKHDISTAKNLKIILSPSTGTDHIDLNEVKKKNIKFFHIAKERKLLDSFTATSELVFGLILNLNRKIILASADAKRGKWSREKFSGFQLKDKTLGIIGLGRLGKITAKIANGFSMNVIGYDLKKKKLSNVKNVSLNYLFKKSDIISIHIHLTKNTENFINKKNLSLMKKNCILINTSRGKIINENDLKYFLSQNKNFHAGLDVIDGEWLSYKKLSHHKLISYSKNNNNLLIVPHIGGSTKESIYGARVFMIRKLLNLIKNKKYGLNK
jgi:D-3-phosphoglycerate dehydrogenase / 2-oxoglutarate reductase